MSERASNKPTTPRGIRWQGWVLTTVLPLATLILLVLPKGRAADYLWTVAVCAAIEAAGFVAYFVWYKRLRRRVTMSEGKLCIRCRYTLLELPAPGTCPECGEQFPEDAHQSCWRENGLYGPR